MTTSLLLILAQTLAPSAVAQEFAAANSGVPAGSTRVQIGRIVSVDTVSMNFVCRTGNFTRQYWIGRATAFRARESGASLFDLRTGEPVEVISHRSGGVDVADLIVS